MNLMQVDASKIEVFIPHLHVLWDGLFQIMGYMSILFWLIGWPCILGLALMVCASYLSTIYFVVCNHFVYLSLSLDYCNFLG